MPAFALTQAQQDRAAEAREIATTELAGVAAAGTPGRVNRPLLATLGRRPSPGRYRGRRDGASRRPDAPTGRARGWRLCARGRPRPGTRAGGRSCPKVGGAATVCAVTRRIPLVSRRFLDLTLLAGQMCMRSDMPGHLS